MIYDPDHQRIDEELDPINPKFSVRVRIIHLLNDYNWWSISKINRVMFASSAHRRLQEIMADDRMTELRGGKRTYEEKWVTKNGCRFKEYRKIASNQGSLF